jgi:hypothetical protein
MSIQAVWQHTFDFFDVPVVVEPSPGQLSSDAGLLPFRQLDQHLGLTDSFAAVLHDPRDPDQIDHSFLDMTRMRVFGILAGYDDQNDHDTLRQDPVFKLLADRSPDGEPLASQPTLSRFENYIDIPSLKRLRDVFIDQFLDSFDQPPRRLTFDLDAVDDPAHGHQQLTFWHGYYDQNQYLPLRIRCAESDQFVMRSLRPGNVHAARGADDDLEYLVPWARDRVAADMLRIDLEAAGILDVVDGPDGPLHADFHSLRHSYLTLGGRAGIDLRTLQEPAGHSRPVLTARYSHRRLHDLDGAVERLPSLLPQGSATEWLRATGRRGRGRSPRAKVSPSLRRG